MKNNYLTTKFFLKFILFAFQTLKLLRFGILSVFFVSLPISMTTIAQNKNHWNIQHWKTPTGVPVYFIETHELPMIDIQIAFKAGSAYDGAQFGLANLTNSLLNQGSQTLSADQIAEKWDMAGANYNAFITRDMSVISVRSVTYPKQLDLAMSTFKHILSQPQFPMDAFERTRNQILQALKQQEQSPDAIASKFFYNILYGNHPYAHPILGEIQTLGALNPEEIKKFYQHYYTANNALIAIVGNLTLNEAKKLSANLSETLKQGQPINPLPPLPNQATALTKHITFPSSQTHFIIGQIALAKSDPDYFPLAVANYALGGGMGSRLYKQVREEQGLAYSVGSNFAPFQEKGPFYIKLQTKSQQKQQGMDLVKIILKDFLEKGVTGNELAMAKQHLRQSFILQLSSNEATLSSIVDIAFYGLPLDFLSTYEKKIEAVTSEQIEKALKKHISPNRFVQVTAGKD